MKSKYLEAIETLKHSHPHVHIVWRPIMELEELAYKATRYESNINIFKEKAKQEIKKITFIDNAMIIEGKDGAIHRFYGYGLK